MAKYSDCQAKAQQASIKYGLPPGLLYSLISFESGCQTDVVSNAGAVGIAQIVPKFHPNVNPLDPASSIDYAGSLLKHAYDRFGSYALAVASYQAGEGNVSKAGNQIPNTTDGLTTTKDYVNRILTAAGLKDDSSNPKSAGFPGMLQPPKPASPSLPSESSTPNNSTGDSRYPFNVNTPFSPQTRKFFIVAVAVILLTVGVFRLK